MINLLDEKSTYTLVDRDPTRKLIETVPSLLTKWRNSGYIDSAIENCTVMILPRAMMFLKIIKLIIQSELLFHQLIEHYIGLLFISDFKIYNIPKPFSYKQNSYELIENLDEAQLNENFSLISLNMAALYTNNSHKFSFEKCK